MFDESGLSLSASDPNPTIDQLGDGGASSDFSSSLSSVAQWGTEIANIVSSRMAVPTHVPAGYSGASVMSPSAAHSQKLMLFLGAGVALAALVWFVNK